MNRRIVVDTIQILYVSDLFIGVQNLKTAETVRRIRRTEMILSKDASISTNVFFFRDRYNTKKIPKKSKKKKFKSFMDLNHKYTRLVQELLVQVVLILLPVLVLVQILGVQVPVPFLCAKSNFNLIRTSSSFRSPFVDTCTCTTLQKIYRIHFAGILSFDTTPIYAIRDF